MGTTNPAATDNTDVQLVSYLILLLLVSACLILISLDSLVNISCNAAAIHGTDTGHDSPLAIGPMSLPAGGSPPR